MDNPDTTKMYHGEGFRLMFCSK